MLSWYIVETTMVGTMSSTSTPVVMEGYDLISLYVEHNTARSLTMLLIKATGTLNSSTLHILSPTMETFDKLSHFSSEEDVCATQAIAYT